jgi:hypothetical protein
LGGAKPLSLELRRSFGLPPCLASVWHRRAANGDQIGAAADKLEGELRRTLAGCNSLVVVAQVVLAPSGVKSALRSRLYLRGWVLIRQPGEILFPSSSRCNRMSRRASGRIVGNSFGGLLGSARRSRSEVSRGFELERENASLKAILAGQASENRALKEISRGHR